MKTLTWNWKRWPFAVAAFFFGALPALAHEKWFTDEHIRYFTQAQTAVPTAFAVSIFLLATAAFVGFWFYERRYKVDRHPGFLKGYVSHIHVHSKTILSVTLGTLLMGSGLQGLFFAPNLALPDTFWGEAIRMAEITIGSLLIFVTPLAAELGIAVGLLYLAGFTVLPFGGMLEELLFLGVAIFLVTSETTRYPWKRWNTLEVERLGYHALRILVGLNFLVLSGVKFFRPDLGMTIVEQYNLNFMASFGVPSSQFIFVAGVVEFFISLAILFKIAMRPAVIAAFSVFVLSIYFLGYRELLGHLPIKATLFILFLLGDWKKGESRIVH